MLNLPGILSVKVSGIYAHVYMYMYIYAHVFKSCLALKNYGKGKYVLERFYEWGQFQTRHK